MEWGERMARGCSGLVGGLSYSLGARSPRSSSPWLTRRWPRYVDVLYSPYLDVTMHWSDGRDHKGRVKHAGSGSRRHCFVFEGHAFKLTEAEKAEVSNLPAAASAAALAGLVPPVYGAFYVDIRDRHLHCLVTMAVDKTFYDQMEEWKREPLTPGIAIAAIQLICRIILFMVYAAGEMKAECHDWHIRHLGMQGERLYLIDWEGTTISPRTRQYSRMKPGLMAFLKWLPGLYDMYDVGRDDMPHAQRTWLEFLEGLRTYIWQEWWPQYLPTRKERDYLPTREDVGELAKSYLWQWRPWTRRRTAFLILLRSQPHVPLGAFFRSSTNLFRRIVLFL